MFEEKKSVLLRGNERKVRKISEKESDSLVSYGKRQEL